MRKWTQALGVQLTSKLLWTTCPHHSDTRKPDLVETAEPALKAMMEERNLAKETVDALLPACVCIASFPQQGQCWADLTEILSAQGG